MLALLLVVSDLDIQEHGAVFRLDFQARVLEKHRLQTLAPWLESS